MARRGAQARDDQCEGAGIPEHERREAPRFKVAFKLSVSLDPSPGGGVLVVPAVARDISRVGALVEARQALAAGQLLTLAIPTSRCPDSMSLPQAFVGPAFVTRVGKTEKSERFAGLRFGEALTQNFEFIGFLDFLHAATRQSTSGQQ
jgi:hypothetical protein